MIYTLEINLNLNEFDPDYPKEPKTLGERIRKVRMDKDLLIKDLAEIIGVTEDTIINWEIRNIQPRGKSLEKLNAFLNDPCP